MQRIRERKKTACILLCFHTVIYLAALIFLRPSFIEMHSDRMISLLGISMLTLQNSIYIYQVYRREIQAERSCFHFLLYNCFFPTLLFGPYISYSNFRKLQQNLQRSAEQVGKGLGQLLCGLTKYVIVAGQLAILEKQMQFFGMYEKNSVLFAWLYLLISFLQFYFQISGCLDAASGLSLCYGYVLPSYKPPFLLWCKRISTFSELLCPSVTQWFLSIFGCNKQKKSNLLCLCAWTLCGLFFRRTVPALFWGIWVGVCILVETVAVSKLQQFSRAVARSGLVLFWIIGWSFFCSDTMKEAISILGMLFGSSGEMVCRADFYFLQNAAILLCICIGYLTGFASLFLQLIKKVKVISNFIKYVMPVVYILLLILILSVIKSGNMPISILQW